MTLRNELATRLWNQLTNEQIESLKKLAYEQIWLKWNASLVSQELWQEHVNLRNEAMAECEQFIEVPEKRGKQP